MYCSLYSGFWPPLAMIVGLFFLVICGIFIVRGCCSSSSWRNIKGWCCCPPSNWRNDASVRMAEMADEIDKLQKENFELKNNSKRGE